MSHLRLTRWLVAGFALLLLNSAYLAASAAPTFLYFSQVVAHPLLGIALLLGASAWLLRRQPTDGSTTSSRDGTRSPLWLAGGGVLGTAGLTGLVILVVGATQPYRWLMATHIATAAAGTVLLVLAAWRSDASRGRAASAPAWRFPALVVALLALAGLSVVARTRAATERRSEFRIVNPAVVPTSMNGEGRGPQSPFFPSSVDTNVGGTIPSTFFLTSETCGRCHKEIYEEWKSSAHHFASFNNQWYRKSIEYMQDVVGTQPSKWCAGCHDHAVLFSGRFDQPIKGQIETPEAQAGLSCTSCHSITRVKSTMGQGDFDIEYPALHDLAASDNPILSKLHDKLVELDPQPHREMFLKPFHREQPAEFCASCHKVHLDVPVNDYRWFRGFNDYDNWQASGVSGLGARSFYYPARPQTCTDCHMAMVSSTDPAAKDGKVRSHRFAAANTALPFVNGDRTQLEAVQEFLKAGQVTLDVFGVARTAAPPISAAARAADADQPVASLFAVGEESLAMGARQAYSTPAAEVTGPFGAAPVVVRRGESVRLEVVVRTRKVGHFFPGGTVDAFDVWLEIEARDDRGRVILHSGALDRGGPVDPGAHAYRSLLLDERGNPINKRNAWAARTAAYVRLIPPGAADTVHYRLDVPEDAGDRITITAKLHYRKFSWWGTQWAYAGVRDPSQPTFALGKGHDDGAWVFSGDTSQVSGPMKMIPDLPVTTMATSEATLMVVPAGAALDTVNAPAPASASPAAHASPAPATPLRERWNDYGIGLLLQGDLKGAEAAFQKVTALEPGYADGWVNVGRVRLQEGRVEAAEQVLRRALEVDPQLAKTHFFLGTALKSLGRYDDALGHLRTAASQYPRDRVVLNQLGRVLFLQRAYAPAIAVLKQVLDIDPEDLQAHYNLMLSYQGLGDVEAAGRARVLYERFKADESSQAITADFRRLNPHENNERQSIHEHRTAPPIARPAS